LKDRKAVEPCLMAERIIKKGHYLRKRLLRVSITFDFSTNVIPLIIREIDSAEKYVRIAIFQLHNENVISALDKKLKRGVKIEILTLPYDSINREIRPKIEPELKKLEKNGATIYFDRWNIGDPSRTTTAVGRWYSFHGKFVVTDKSAIALSANLTQDQELDAVIIFGNDITKIKEFNQQFDRLIELFVTRNDSSDGTIKEKIVEVTKAESQAIFELPKDIGEEHRNHWIRQYPLEICQPAETIEEKLYLTPFDCKGREILTSLVNDAEKYAYISTESFTDLEFSEFLVGTALNKKIEIKILTGATSMDFTDRMESMLRDLLAHGIDVRTTSEDLHAKLLVTDKVVVVSSINLNKMNLGFHTSKRYWRENTESVFVCKKNEVTKVAKEKFLEILNNSQGIEARLAGKLEAKVKDTFAKTFGLKSSPDARKLFAKFILKKQLESRLVFTKVGKITKKLMDHYKRDKIEKQDFVSAIILYYLSERKQDISNLKEKIDDVDKNLNLTAAINALEFSGFVEKEGDYFKINIEALFS